MVNLFFILPPVVSIHYFYLFLALWLLFLCEFFVKFQSKIDFGRKQSFFLGAAGVGMVNKPLLRKN